MLTVNTLPGYSLAFLNAFDDRTVDVLNRYSPSASVQSFWGMPLIIGKRRLAVPFLYNVPTSATPVTTWQWRGRVDPT